MGYTNYSLEAHTDESNRRAVWEDVCTLCGGLFKEGASANLSVHGLTSVNLPIITILRTH